MVFSIEGEYLRGSIGDLVGNMTGCDLNVEYDGKY